jgi:glycosyltransferase involved in cell wall biosynthesis
MADYAIIIPAFNEEDYLGETLRAARAAMATIKARGELIVVDNNSSDRTAEVAREHGADRVVFEEHNQIARARNAGAGASVADHLVFIDADTCVEPETLATALEYLSTGRVVAGGARIVVDQPVIAVVDWLVDLWNLIAAKFHYAAGSFFFCDREVFEAVGGFDESIYAGEEVWLARRIKKWARPRRLEFRVISDPPVMTSGRKSDWFSTWEFVWQLAILFLIPGAARSRRLCGIWYRRPEVSPQEGAESGA